MRRIARDTQERGRTEESVRRQFREHVDPMHDRYVQPQRQCADVVLSADFSDVDVEVLWQRANQ
jgi:uridine kinase